jgi:hypothetical protein
VPRHVYAVAPYVSALDDDVTGIDAHAELDPLLLWQVGVTLAHRALDLGGPAHRRYHAGKLYQQPIADDPHDPAASRYIRCTLRNALGSIPWLRRTICADELGTGIGIALDVYHVWWDPDLEREVERPGRTESPPGRFQRQEGS